MKPEKTQFRQALSDRSSGKNSDLYKAIHPLISADTDTEATGADAENLKGLHEDVRKGLVGLEYLTGLKQNTGETFYDKHPVQAVVTDALKHSGGIGAGVAGLGIASNLLTQHGNMKKTEPASMSREKNPTGDRKHPLESLKSKKDKPVSPDLAKLFGDVDTDPETRLKLIDRLQKNNSTDPNSFYSRYDAARNTPVSDYEQALKDIDAEAKITHADPKQQQAHASQIKERRSSAEALHKAETAKRDAAIKKVIDEAHSSEGFQGLGKHVDFHHSLQDAQQKGGFGKYFGEGLNTAGEEGGKLQEFIRRFIAPSQDQGAMDLMEKRHLTGAHPHMDKELTKNILAHNLGIDPNSERMRAIMETGYARAQDVKHQGSGLRRALVRHRAPLLAGAGIAAGGAGLYKLIKAIQNQAYSDDQVNEWKKTLLKSRGDFEGADQIQ
jgi:hypothetical protein